MHYFVSSGLLNPKKSDTQSNRFNRYLNYPLVGLASIAAETTADVAVVHGGYASPQDVCERLDPRGDDSFFLSLPSVYSVPWAAGFIADLESRGYSRRIVCGGRWVLDGRLPWVRQKLRYGNLDFVEGFGECFLRARFRVAEGHPDDLRSHDYTLMPDYLEYQPSIEVSRGCGRGCHFCSERSASRQTVVSGSLAAQLMAELEELYSPLTCRPFIEASLFSPSRMWIEGFGNEYAHRGVMTEWRAQTRVDVLGRGTIRDLASAGLRVLDLGLESASSRSLLAMGKTRNPTRYLERATETLETCADVGIQVKLNLVFYAGDALADVQATLAWLRERRGLFRGVSASPFIYYPNTMSTSLPSGLKGLGASLAHPEHLADSGVGDLNLSPEIGNREAIQMCTDVAQEFMTARDYYELKMFGYFSPTLSYESFVKSALDDDSSVLPFRV